MIRPDPITILLKVYDLHQSNSILHTVGTGFYHTGVEVNGYEFSFSESGVVRTRPSLPQFGELRDSIVMGTYTEGMTGIYSIISNLRNDRFQPGSYDVVTLNCNHFSDSFCVATVNTHIPVWVNRMAEIGSNFSAQPSSPTGGQSNDMTAMKAPGVVKSPELPTVNTSRVSMPDEPNLGPGTASSFSIFNLFGWGANGGKSPSSSANATNPAAAPNSVTSAQNETRKSNPKAKKELSAKQKELLAKTPLF
eukprot:CAMPEP_0174990440 /NCGR_PEP_ID=MMETSP0004_2-20121128/21322_1 /TAXON_ID=420556 /ORGANISM="Ochromonas sp., Strain CCMP1393" /LENGTH=249 /DNA_ID=CAMNT_0016244047 /DNA_START=71 /DNA_END=820 /DNA_ORIENTATION=+